MKTVQKLVLAAMLAMAAMVALTLSTQGPTGPPPRSVVEDGTEQDAAMTAIDSLKFRERGRGRPGQAGGDRRVEGGGGGRKGPSLFSHNVAAAKPAAPAKEKAAPAVAVDLTEVKRRGLRGEHPHVVCDTNEGRMVLEVRFDWSPLGAERFVALVDDGFFTNNVFYRVTPIKEMAIAQVRVCIEHCTPLHTHAHTHTHTHTAFQRLAPSARMCVPPTFDADVCSPRCLSLFKNLWDVTAADSPQRWPLILHTAPHLTHVLSQTFRRQPPANRPGNCANRSSVTSLTRRCRRNGVPRSRTTRTPGSR